MNPDTKDVSTHKTTISKEMVRTHVRNLYGVELENLEYISGGESSQAFGYRIGTEEYIIRVNRHDSRGYEKDRYAYQKFNSIEVPIPEVLQIGQLENGYYFCISRKAVGETANHLSVEQADELVPNLFATLDAIHGVDVSSSQGYGKWYGEGIAEHTSWKEVILSVNNHIVDEDTGTNLFETTFLEKEFWESVYEKISELMTYCPEERYLVHADYGFDNLVVNRGKITGVIDWEQSMYGDFLYDVAWLSFWSKDHDYEQEYLAHHTHQEIPFFKERVFCYKLRIGLSSLSFYAYSNQKDKYDRSKERLLKLLPL